MKNIFIVLILLCVSIFKMEAQMESANFSSNKDSYVISSSTTNFGTSGELQAGISVDKFGVATFRRSYLYFPISGIPTNAVITSAVLKVYQTAGATTSPNTQLYAERVIDSWGETTIASGSEPNVSTSEMVTSSTYASSWRSFDVKLLVQKMVEGTYTNQGFRIRYHNEGQTTTNLYKFHSREAANDPVLEIAYYVPFKITAASITHCSTTSSTDGAINPTIEKGSGSNTYQWFNSTDSITGATSLNLSGRTYGWYGLRVTGSQGDKFYYSFLIGVNCANVSINYNPGANYIDDALLSSFQPTTNLGTSVSFRDSKTTLGISSKSLLKFRLWVDPNISFSQAGLNLYANTHDISNSNASFLRKVTSTWSEGTVTWNTVPSATTTNQISLAASTTTSQNYLLNNTISFWNDWKGNNPNNYGMLLELQTSTNSNRAMSFHSSDASSSKPSMTFTLSLNPTLTGTVTAGSNHICNGTSTVVTVSGYMSGSTFQWQKSTNGTSYSNISGATSSTYTTLTSTSVDTYYRCIVSKGSCSSLTTNFAFVQIKPIPYLTVNKDYLCATTSATLTATPSAGGGTYLWSNSATTASINVSPSTTTNYTVVYTLNGCASPQASGTVFVCSSSFQFVDSTELGQISVSINEAPVKMAPYHYMVSQNPILDFGSVYHIINDSIYGGELDSTAFFTGSTTEPNHTFMDLKMGKYFVSVFDSKGIRIFDREVLVIPTITLSNNSNMTIAGNQISSTGSNAYTMIDLYISNNDDGEFGFVIPDKSKVQYMGFVNSTETVSNNIGNYISGFSIKSTGLYLIENGVEGSTSYSISNGSEIKMRIVDSLLEFYSDSLLLKSISLPDTFCFKIGYSSAISGVFANLIPLSFTKKKFFIDMKKLYYYDCENEVGGFNFKVSNTMSLSLPFTWTVLKDGVPISSGGPNYYFVNNFDPSTYGPGIYEIFGYTVYGGTVHSCSTKVYVGVEVSWANVVNYDNVPNSFSVERNNINPNTWSNARSENTLKSEETGWIEFTPIFSNGFIVPNILRLSTLNMSDLTPVFLEDFYIMPFKLGNARYIYWSGPNPGIQPISNNSSILLKIEANQIMIYSKINSIETHIDDFAIPTNSTILLRAHSYRNGSGFDNVITSFDCAIPTIYAKLERQLTGVKYQAQTNKVYFFYDEEYASTGNLEYNVYDKNNNSVLSTTSQVLTHTVGTVNREYGDNRYSLNVIGLDPGAYVLEVVNEKGEKVYLRFVK